MTKLITETPDHPIPFLIDHLQTKQDSPGKLHRALSGSAALWAQSSPGENTPSLPSEPPRGHRLYTWKQNEALVFANRQCTRDMNRAANVEHECTVASVKQTQTLIIKPKMKGVTMEIDTTKKEGDIWKYRKWIVSTRIAKMLSKFSIASEYLLFYCWLWVFFWLMFIKCLQCRNFSFSLFFFLIACAF